jgi:hypothetical protein
MIVIVFIAGVVQHLAWLQLHCADCTNVIQGMSSAIVYVSAAVSMHSKRLN